MDLQQSSPDTQALTQFILILFSRPLFLKLHHRVRSQNNIQTAHSMKKVVRGFYCTYKLLHIVVRGGGYLYALAGIKIPASAQITFKFFKNKTCLNFHAKNIPIYFLNINKTITKYNNKQQNASLTSFLWKIP